MFALNRKVFRIVYDEVIKFEGERNENPWRYLFFELIYPNHYHQTPFDIVFDKRDLNSSQTLDIIMKMF